MLVHSAAGGVGMAATQVARWLGAEVYATASPGKWDALRAGGLADDRIASSRTLEFAERFDRVDVVLNSLAGEYVDGSLGLLADGGRFLEMGKTDIRDGERVAAEHGVRYQAFDLMDAGADRIGELLQLLVSLFEQGVHHAADPVLGCPADGRRAAFPLPGTPYRQAGAVRSAAAAGAGHRAHHGRHRHPGWAGRPSPGRTARGTGRRPGRTAGAGRPGRGRTHRRPAGIGCPGASGRL
ncbi:hypothetical protein SANTM175S_05214 [Streptomyces antimycoticus]